MFVVQEEKKNTPGFVGPLTREVSPPPNRHSAWKPQGFGGHVPPKNDGYFVCQQVETATWVISYNPPLLTRSRWRTPFVGVIT